MAFTREFIRKTAKECGLEIPKEFENALVDEHLSARDTYAEAQVKDALEKNKPAEPPKIKDTDEYKALKKEYEDYKAEVSGKEAKAAKERAARAFFEGRGITGKSLDIAIRGSGAEIEALELDGDKIKDASALEALVKDTYAGLVAKTETRGAQTATPPAVSGGKKLSKDDIFRKDDRGRYVMGTAERQRAIAENLDAFSGGNN